MRLGKLISRIKGIGIALILIVALISNAKALDKQISIQGKLTDATGGVKTGVHDLYFGLYVSSGGNPVWGPERYNVDLGNDGLFNVTLASTSLDGIAFNQQYYVGIKVDGESEMVPRQKLSASPYALGSVGDFNVGKNLNVSGNQIVNGNMGIGINNPGSILDVAIPYSKLDTNVREVAHFRTNDSSNPFYLRVQLAGNSADAGRNARLQTTTEGYLNGGNLVLQPNGGNVGIGTVSPYGKLNINTNGSAVNNNGIIIGAMGDSLNTNVPLNEECGRFEIVFPTWKYYGNNLAVGGKITAIRKNVYADNQAWNQGVELAFCTSNGGWNVDNSLYDASTERMRINSVGNVGIGTTSPGYTLTIWGNAWVNSGTWTGSDIRYKENIEDFSSDTLQKVLKLKGRKYNLKKEIVNKRIKEKYGSNAEKNETDRDEDATIMNAKQIGVIAQEIEIEFPELVHTDKDGYKAVAYDKLVVVLLEAIKAQQSQIVKQQDEIAKMETRIKTLEANK